MSERQRGDAISEWELLAVSGGGNCQLSRFLGQLRGVLLREWELLAVSGLHSHNTVQWGWCFMSERKWGNTVAKLHTGSGLPRLLGKLWGLRCRWYANS